jgi:hypothetical protein
LHIFKNPKLGNIWLNRHQDDASMRAMKREFRAVSVQKVVRSVDARLGKIYRMLYQRTIDFGGHPNVMSVTGNMTMTEQEDRVMMNHLYLNGDDDALLMVLKTSAQVGLTSLLAFQHVFQERFMLLGLRERLLQCEKWNSDPGTASAQDCGISARCWLQNETPLRAALPILSAGLALADPRRTLPRDRGRTVIAALTPPRHVPVLAAPHAPPR